MIHVPVRLTIREVRRLWDLLEHAELILKQEAALCQEGSLTAKIFADARHDYADIQQRLDCAVEAYDPLQPEGGPALVERDAESRGGL